jgi:hypothetical protein
MKNIFFALAISATAISVNAQFTLRSVNTNYFNPCEEDIRINFGGNYFRGDAHSNAIDSRAIEHFRKQFPTVINPYWYKTNDGYIASSQENSVETKVAYNLKGKLNHTINYYGEKNLPRSVWETIKSSYYAYDILRVAEVHFNDKTVYMVYLESETQLRTVRVVDGEVEEVQSFTRG